MGLRCTKQRHKPRISKLQIPWLLRGAIRSNNMETLQYLFSYPHKVDPSMVIDGVCLLNLAVELGHVQVVKILIKAGADIHVADVPRYPLHQASLFGRGPVIELLLRSGASISALTERRQSCLHLLSHQSSARYVDAVHVLMKFNANPNTLDDDGLAPLHRASVEMVHALAAYDVTDMNICSREGDTPLLTAVKDRREAVVAALLSVDKKFREYQAKGETHKDSVVSKTPLDAVVSVTADETEANQPSALRSASAKSTTSTTSRITVASASSVVVHGTQHSFTKHGVLRALSAASMNIHSVGDPRKPAVPTTGSQQCPHHHKEILGSEPLGIPHLRSCLLRLSGKHGKITRSPEHATGRTSGPTISLNHTGSSHFFAGLRSSQHCKRCHSVGNPSDISGWWPSYDRLQRFLGKPGLSIPLTNAGEPESPLRIVNSRPRVDLDKPDRIGMTPLIIAAEAGSVGLQMTIDLVQAGSNVAATDKAGMNALHHACYVGSLSVVRYLLERVGGCASTSTTTTTTTKSPDPLADQSSRLSMTSSSRAVVIPELLNVQDKCGRTPIYLAACRGHTEVVNYLLSLSADFHIPNRENKSPLYISAYFGYLDITNALLRHGAQVDQLDSHRKTPLYVAVYHGRVEIVDLLLSAGASVNAADKNGKTPLYIAVLHGHLDLAKKLLKAGASVNRVDREGLGPLHMAVKFPKLDIPMVKLLLSYGCDPVNLASFTRWLLVHGIIPQECIHGDDELASWLQWEECNVRSLKRLCRVVIQRCLGHGDSMRVKLHRLPLPEHLLSFISMKEL